MTEMSNPFQEESHDLLSLETKDIAHPNAAELISAHYERAHTLPGITLGPVSKVYERTG